MQLQFNEFDESILTIDAYDGGSILKGKGRDEPREREIGGVGFIGGCA